MCDSCVARGCAWGIAQCSENHVRFWSMARFLGPCSRPYEIGHSCQTHRSLSVWTISVFRRNEISGSILARKEVLPTAKLSVQPALRFSSSRAMRSLRLFSRFSRTSTKLAVPNRQQSRSRSMMRLRREVTIMVAPSVDPQAVRPWHETGIWKSIQTLQAKKRGQKSSHSPKTGPVFHVFDSRIEASFGDTRPSGDHFLRLGSFTGPRNSSSHRAQSWPPTPSLLFR